MGIALEELQRAGLVVEGNVVKKGTHVTTHIRSAAADTRQADILTDSSGTAPKLECDAGDGGLAALPVQEAVGRRFLVRVEAVRTRLLDEDNMCEKFHVDLLRYASGKVFGDAPGTTKIEVSQKKAGPGEREEVRIEVYEL